MDFQSEEIVDRTAKLFVQGLVLNFATGIAVGIAKLAQLGGSLECAARVPAGHLRHPHRVEAGAHLLPHTLGAEAPRSPRMYLRGGGILLLEGL